jgi:hypothetical protein
MPCSDVPYSTPGAHLGLARASSPRRIELDSFGGGAAAFVEIQEQGDSRSAARGRLILVVRREVARIMSEHVDWGFG